MKFPKKLVQAVLVLSVLGVVATSFDLGLFGNAGLAQIDYVKCPSVGDNSLTFSFTSLSSSVKYHNMVYCLNGSNSQVFFTDYTGSQLGELGQVGEGVSLIRSFHLSSPIAGGTCHVAVYSNPLVAGEGVATISYLDCAAGEVVGSPPLNFTSTTIKVTTFATTTTTTTTTRFSTQATTQATTNPTGATTRATTQPTTTAATTTTLCSTCHVPDEQKDLIKNLSWIGLVGSVVTLSGFGKRVGVMVK